MNLIYETNGEEEVKTKKYIGLIIAIIIVFVLTVALGIWLFVLVEKEENSKIRISLDEKGLTGFSDNFIYKDGKNTYVSVKEMAQIMDYSVYNGGYKEYTEEQNRCYIENEEQVVDFTVNSDSFAKITKTRDNEKFKYFKIEQKILQVNDNLYISLDGAEVAFNLDITQNGNKIQIYTLDYIVDYYSKMYENLVADDIFEKQLLMYGAMIVKDEQGRLGINNLNNETIVGTKYSDISFEEETKEFYITTAENNKGLLDLQGNIILSPQYDEIDRISKDLELYIVKRNGKYGIVNQKNDIVVYVELDGIGLENYSDYNEVKNPYLLYDTVIPVMYDDKWGLLDTNGKVVLPLEYDGFGTAGTIKGKDQHSMMLVQDYKSIIVKKNEYYGVINYKGETLIPFALTDVYYTISSGKKVYTMVYLDETIDVLDYLKEKYLKENTNQKDVEVINEEEDEEW